MEKMMAKYKKKPVVIEAIRFTGSNYKELEILLGKILSILIYVLQYQHLRGLKWQRYVTISSRVLEGSFIYAIKKFSMKPMR